MMNILRSIWHVLYAIRISILLGVAAAVLGLYSLGMLGYFLYYATYPLVVPFHGAMWDWPAEGAVIWGLFFLAGMRWGFCFPVAGLVDVWLKRRTVKVSWRILCYLAILWVGSALIWHYIILYSIPG